MIERVFNRDSLKFYFAHQEVTGGYIIQTSQYTLCPYCETLHFVLTALETCRLYKLFLVSRVRNDCENNFSPNSQFMNRSFCFWSFSVPVRKYQNLYFLISSLQIWGTDKIYILKTYEI